MMLFLLLACQPKTAPDDSAVDDSAATTDILDTLAAPGPYNVGYHPDAVVYADPDGEGDRELRLAIWYPTLDESGEDAEYLLPKADPGAWQDATPADGPFPLVVFSHGHQGFAENSSFLMVHLASHGYVVAAPDHTGNTTFDGGDRDTAIYYQRPLDLSAVLDYLDAPPAGHPLAGHVTVSPTLAIGHSFGGYTVFAWGGADYDADALAASCADGTGNSNLCASWDDHAYDLFAGGLSDPRVNAFIAMAPGDHDLFSQAGLGDLPVPVLLMSGDLDGGTAGGADLYWRDMPAGDHRLSITGAGHQSFTDFSGILETGDGLIDADEGFRIIDIVALAFAWSVAGDARGEEVLSGTLSVSDAAKVEVSGD